MAGIVAASVPPRNQCEGGATINIDDHPPLTDWHSNSRGLGRHTQTHPHTLFRIALLLGRRPKLLSCADLQFCLFFLHIHIWELQFCTSFQHIHISELQFGKGVCVFTLQNNYSGLSFCASMPGICHSVEPQLHLRIIFLASSPLEPYRVCRGQSL